MRVLSLFIFLCVGAQLFAQNSSESLAELEVRLSAARKAILSARSDEQRQSTNAVFLEQLEYMLSRAESRAYPFDSLIGTMAVLESPDKAFRIFNWNLPSEDQTHEFFGFIQRVDPKTKQYQLIQLQDQSWNLSRPENKQLPASKWYGALYYEIIVVEGKRNDNPNYVMLGWDGYSKTTQQKVIETMTFQSNGDVRFGLPILKAEKGLQKRVVFQYSSEASMSLKWHPRKKMIVFDHLSPRAPELIGMYQFYGPDLSYDALRLKKGKWHYEKDVDVRMPNNDRGWNKPK